MGTEYIAVGFTILFTIATSALLGGYMFKVFTGRRTLLDPVFVPIERLVLRLTGVDPNQQQDWKQYSVSLLVSNIAMWLATFAVVMLQKGLPINPDGIANMEPTLAFNTISSFVTNTNLQHYSGETGLSYFSQMFVISFLQFVTAGTGIAAAVAVIRGPGRQSPDAAWQFLRRPHARDGPGLSAAGAARVGPRDVAGHADDVRGRRQGDHGRRPGADDCPGCDRRASCRSNSWARTAAATSARIRRIRTRIPRRWPTSSRPGRSRSSRCRWW